jgi:predicted nucleotidyltransferase
LIDLRLDLETLLGRKVDVVSERGIHPYLKETILSEARDL